MHSTIFLIVTLSTWAAIVSAAPERDAQMRFVGTSRDGRSYFTSNRLQKQEEAFKECRENEMELASVLNEEEVNKILDHLIGYEYLALWTSGVTHDWSSKNYQWLNTHSNIEYFNWATGQPDNNLAESSWANSGIILTKKSGWQWELVPDQELHQALCQSTRCP